jgi:ferredoxin
MSDEILAGDKGKKFEDIKEEAEKRKCPVQKALYLVEEFIAGPMCGKCLPCSLGTNEAKIRLIRISRHSEGVSDADIQALNRIGVNMAEGAFCKKGKDTGKFIVEMLAGSGEEFKEHVTGVCPENECKSFLEYVIRPELCNMCGKCAEACKYHAIIGEKRQSYLSGYLPFEIRQKRCEKCGECFKVCPTWAIEVTTKKIEELVKG